MTRVAINGFGRIGRNSLRAYLERRVDFAQLHLDAGAGKVVVSAVAEDADVMLVLGVNQDAYDPDRHRIVSNASCTTNCVTPLAKVIDDAFTIERGFMTTVHAYTATQPLLDAPHKDLRRARAAAINLIPTTTGAARALTVVLPALDRKIGAMAIRAPIPVGSIVDLVVQVAHPVDRDQVNAAFAAAAGGPLGQVLPYADEPLVSSDVVGSPYSCVFDSQLTMAEGGLVKVFGWYDNEWGYSCRLVDVVELVGATR
jgi:glyceraldehyde 3-phosphate dehydrogenase